MSNKETEEERKNRELFMKLFMAHKELVSVLRNQKRLQQREEELNELIRDINKEVLA